MRGMHITAIAAILLAASAPIPQDHAQHQHPPSRAAQGMGFDQDRTQHHFLIEKDGGTIQVSSAAGHGTTFTLTLPVS